MKKSCSKPDFISHLAFAYTIKASIILILIITLFKPGLAQDTIIVKTGEKIICTIAKVDSKNIRFSKRSKTGSMVNTFIPMESVIDYRYGPKLREANYWFNIGVGYGLDKPIGDNMGMGSFGLNFSSQTKKGLISIRVIYNQMVTLWSLAESVGDLGALYGGIAKTSYGFASISGGLGLVSGKQMNRSETWNSFYQYDVWQTSYFTVGIPLEGQLFWTISPSIGLGFYGFANINPEKSFFGGLFCIQLGKLK